MKKEGRCADRRGGRVNVVEEGGCTLGGRLQMKRRRKHVEEGEKWHSVNGDESRYIY